MWGNFKRETESLQIAAQNYSIRTNRMKGSIDKTQQNIKWRLWGDRDETINGIVSECNKLAQKEHKTRHDWVGKVIHWGMCRKFRFDHTNKWYIHKAGSVRLNDTWIPMGLWHTNRSRNLGQKTRLYNNQQNKEKLLNCWICCPGWPHIKTERMWKEG